MEDTKDTDIIEQNQNYTNSFRNICETEDEVQASIKQSDRDCMMDRMRSQEILNFSKRVQKEKDTSGNKGGSDDEIELSGDEESNPFDELEKIHDSKMKEQTKNGNEEWINNYVSEKGEEMGARITGSRLIESGIKKTIYREGGNEPTEKGRMGKKFENETGRRPVDIAGSILTRFQV